MAFIYIDQKDLRPETDPVYRYGFLLIVIGAATPIALGIYFDLPWLAASMPLTGPMLGLLLLQLFDRLCHPEAFKSDAGPEGKA